MLDLFYRKKKMIMSRVPTRKKIATCYPTVEIDRCTSAFSSFDKTKQQKKQQQKKPKPKTKQTKKLNYFNFIFCQAFSYLHLTVI